MSLCREKVTLNKNLKGKFVLIVGVDFKTSDTLSLCCLSTVNVCVEAKPCLGSSYSLPLYEYFPFFSLPTKGKSIGALPFHIFGFDCQIISSPFILKDLSSAPKEFILTMLCSEIIICFLFFLVYGFC